MVRSNILIVVLGKKKQDGSSSVSTTWSKTTQAESISCVFRYWEDKWCERKTPGQAASDRQEKCRNGSGIFERVGKEFSTGYEVQNGNPQVLLVQ